MIKYETIISNFDDKTTLYNWLRKVEEALKNASATNFVVNKKGNATLSFSITFADGTTLESGDIVLQQGESVDDARIASGVLQLHLTNGTWLTAGNIKPVSNFEIDASQHLIVNYQDGTSQDLGAIFNGNINISGNITATGTIDGNEVTGNEIKEKMSGYSFARYGAGLTNWTPVYVGAVKNGNKLTFVIFGAYRCDTTPSAQPLGEFIIPNDVGAKLYPYTLGADADVLDAKVVNFFEDLTTYKNAIVEVEKTNNTKLQIVLRPIDLESAETYYFRAEVTFLLSDSLVSE